jgi:hypothetical protein
MLPHALLNFIPQLRPDAHPGLPFASLQDVKGSAYSLDGRGAEVWRHVATAKFGLYYLAYPPFKPKPFAQLKSLCR